MGKLNQILFLGHLNYEWSHARTEAVGGDLSHSLALKTLPIVYFDLAPFTSLRILSFPRLVVWLFL